MKRFLVIASLLALFNSSDAQAQNATAQFIHGSADPSLSLVDVHIDNQLFLQNFAFREATSYLDIPTDVDFTIDITLPGQDPLTESLYHFDGFTNPGLTFTIFLRGVADTTLFAANPDANEPRSTELQFRINPTARETPPGNNQLAWFNFYNGITDSPPFNVWASADSTVLSTIGALHYSAFTGYISSERGLLVFDRVNPVDSSVLDSYAFDFSSIPNSTVTIFGTGFADVDNNQNGSAIAFHAALADGTVIPSTVVTNVESTTPLQFSQDRLKIYPNPVASDLHIDTEELEPGAQLDIFDSLGRRVLSVSASDRSSLSVKDLPNGLYHVLATGSSTLTRGSFVVRH